MWTQSYLSIIDSTYLGNRCNLMIYFVGMLETDGDLFTWVGGKISQKLPTILLSLPRRWLAFTREGTDAGSGLDHLNFVAQLDGRRGSCQEAAPYRSFSVAERFSQGCCLIALSVGQGFNLCTVASYGPLKLVLNIGPLILGPRISDPIS